MNRESFRRIGLGLCLVCACAHQGGRDPDASTKRLVGRQDHFAKALVAAALTGIGRALEVEPENPDAHYLMGVVKMGQGVDHLELAERTVCLRGVKAEAERADAIAKMREA